MHRRGFKNVYVYLDDFVLCEDTKELCLKAYNCLLDLLRHLGFTINWKKVVEPTQKLVFLGIEIDSVNMTLSMPQDKLCDLRNELSVFQLRKKASKRQLQQLVGKLNWASKMLRTSRPFIRRLIDLSCVPKRPSHLVRLSTGTREDLRWLLAICDRFNGTVILPKLPQPEHALSTDASIDGGAAFMDGDWFYTHWNTDFSGIAPMHINLKELFVVLLSCRRWCHKWKDKCIALFTDNTTTLFVVNKGSMRNTDGMLMLREIFYLQAVYNFKLIAHHVKSKDNVIADALSRLDNPEFALTAAECLVHWNVMLLCNDFDFQAYMTLNSYMFISQALSQLKRDIWRLML